MDWLQGATHLPTCPHEHVNGHEKDYGRKPLRTEQYVF